MPAAETPCAHTCCPVAPCALADGQRRKSRRGAQQHARPLADPARLHGVLEEERHPEHQRHHAHAVDPGQPQARFEARPLRRGRGGARRRRSGFWRSLSAASTRASLSRSSAARAPRASALGVAPARSSGGLQVRAGPRPRIPAGPSGFGPAPQGRSLSDDGVQRTLPVLQFVEQHGEPRGGLQVRAEAHRIIRLGELRHQGAASAGGSVAANSWG